MDYKDYKAGISNEDFWVRGKRDLIEKRLKKNKKKNLKILNLGAGTGNDLDIISRFGRVYVIDIEKNALDLVPREMCFEKKLCDARKIRYPDNFFDLVISFDVFEHIKEDYMSIRESYRVLKKGGRLIFSVPAFQSLYSAHDKGAEHQRRYSKNRLKYLLKDFKELKLNYWNFFLFLPIAFIRIIKKNSKVQVDHPKPFWLVNNIFFRLLKLENILIEKGFRFPFGITLIGIAEK